MSNVVNLNRFRKEKARAKKEQYAAENRKKFGRTKSEKEQEATEQSRLGDHLDQHERTPQDDE